MNLSGWLYQISQVDINSSKQKKRHHYPVLYERETVRLHSEPNEEKNLAFKDLPAKVDVIGMNDKVQRIKNIRQQ